MSLAQLLKAHGDPVLTAQALGRPVPVVAPAASAPPPVSFLPVSSSPVALAPVALNVDRIASNSASAPAPAIAPAASLAPTVTATMPAATWLDWVKAHWLWILAAFLVLLVIAYASQRSSNRPRESGFRPSRMVKGSPEAKAHMASLRSRKSRG